MDAANPFAALTLIAAPAILTNACSVMVLSTSNRLARAVDRARELTAQLEQEEVREETPETLCLRELQGAEQRSLILLRALRLFYGALGGFAGSAFVSLLGAVLVTGIPAAFAYTLEIVAVLAGLVAVSSLVYGSILLVKETRIAVQVLHEQAVYIKSKVDQRLKGAQAVDRVSETPGLKSRTADGKPAKAG